MTKVVVVTDDITGEAIYIYMPSSSTPATLSAPEGYTPRLVDADSLPTTEVSRLLWDNGWSMRPARPDGHYIWIDGQWVFDVETARSQARAEIDQAAGAARARYVTIAPGQEATYTAKYEQAKQFLANPEPDVEQYPWINFESQTTGLSPHATAMRITELGDQWAMLLGPVIEGIRIAGKDGLELITDQGSMRTHVEAVLAQLHMI